MEKETKTIETGILVPTYPNKMAVVKFQGDDHLTVLHILKEERGERITGGEVTVSPPRTASQGGESE